MAGLSLSHIYKVYPNGTKAVNDLNLEIKDKEFIVFVGPSGCGKSTSLRMIAGLEEITTGELRIGDEVVNDLGPSERDTAMVFQNYSLYPHLSVFQNIAFPLKMMKVPKEEIDEKVNSTAKILGLENHLHQKPDTLSGGQRQRVALGRAIVREPKVFLLDEPLSNLDAKLRTQMRTEITKLHKRLQTTFIYVTHDQVEAMTMGDRIVVMKDGFVQQIDTPTNLYRYPVNKFVGEFIGTPPMNFYEARVKVEAEVAEITFGSNRTIKVPCSDINKLEKDYLHGKSLIMGVRPENIRIIKEKTPMSIPCKIIQKEILGSDTLFYCDLDIKSIDYENSRYGLIIKVPGLDDASAGIINIEFDFTKVHFFDSESEKCVSKRMVEKESLQVKISNSKLDFCGNIIPLPMELQNLQGEYMLVFPTDAFIIGKSFKAKVLSSESIGDKYLVRLNLLTNDLWATFPVKVSGEISLDLDFKKINFIKNGKIEKEALPEYNSLIGILEKKKRKDKNVNGLKFDVIFKIEEVELECPPEMIKRLLAISDRKIFNLPLELQFPLASIRSGNEIFGKMIKVLDYGIEQFVVIQVGDSKILLPLAQAGSMISFKIDMNKVSLIEPETGIRI